MRDLTRGPITGHLVALAAPIAFGLMIQTLYYLVDLYFVSRLGETALAGVQTAGNVMFLVMALTQMLSTGTLATVSHAVGSKDQDRANLIFNQAIFLALLLALVAVTSGYFGLADLYVGWIGADSQTIAAGSLYLHWVLPAIAMQLLMGAMVASLQGTGIVKPTLVVQILTVLVNTALTPILVGGWISGYEMGVAGAALATVLASVVGVLLMLVYFLRLEHYISFRPSQMKPRLQVLRSMLVIGLPAGGQLALMFVYMGIVYAVIRPFGASAQAGYGVGMRVMQAVFLPAMAISFAAPSIAGQNFGAQQADRVRETFKRTLFLTCSTMAVLTLVCQWRPEALIQPFSSDPEVLAVAASFLTVISWNFVAAGVNFTCSGLFQAMGNTLPALASTALRLVTFVGPAFWLASRPNFAIGHVWYLSVVTVTFQAALSLILLFREFSRRLDFPPADPLPTAESLAAIP